MPLPVVAVCPYLWSQYAPTCGCGMPVPGSVHCHTSLNNIFISRFNFSCQLTIMCMFVFTCLCLYWIRLTKCVHAVQATLSLKLCIPHIINSFHSNMYRKMLKYKMHSAMQEPQRLCAEAVQATASSSSGGEAKEGPSMQGWALSHRAS